MMPASPTIGFGREKCRSEPSCCATDMIVAGGPGLSLAQSELQMAMWAIWSAPLMLSVDLASVTADFKAVLQNREVIGK